MAIVEASLKSQGAAGLSAQSERQLFISFERCYMECAQIITASELEVYAGRRDSQAIIPELVSKLINASVDDLAFCRIPYGDKVNEPGWDGLVETSSGYRQFVPQGKSFWEIGTSADPQDKATSDFKKRTDQMAEVQRRGSSYVFVTPRGAGAGGWNEPTQTAWKLARASFGWQRIAVLDGHQIADWLRDFPSIGRWLAKEIGILKTDTGVVTPTEHWDHLKLLAMQGNPSLFYKIFVAGRDGAVAGLHRLFRDEINQLLLIAEGVEDSEDFVAAFLESLDEDTRRQYASRCLFVRDTSTWLSLANLRRPHVLVAHPKLDIGSDTNLVLAARRNGHRMIIPVFGMGMRDNAESMLPIRSPSKWNLEAVLRECGYEEAKARELAGAGALSLAAFKRHLLGLGDLPPYASWPNARLLAQFGLVGAWQDASPEDRRVLERIVGKPYGEWIETARNDALRADTPLMQRNEMWKLIARGEVWNALGPRITDDDLDRFRQIALDVLGEEDPKFDLPPEDHSFAVIKGKQRRCSDALQNGIAESLALLGSRPHALTSCSRNKAASLSAAIVKELLDGKGWKAWASLHNQLPLLAEAAPHVFLSAVENALADPQQNPFLGVFQQEARAPSGWNYMSGLLWALETLAWHEDYLVPVILILGELASIDPGGSWSNRPEASIRDILLPWFPQTAASIARRVAAIEALLKEQPSIGWKVLLALLPSGHGVTTGTAKPIWRTFIPENWKDGASHAVYWDQVYAHAELVTRIAATDHDKLAELIDRLPDLPQPAYGKVLEHLASSQVVAMSEQERLPLWEALVDLTAKHRRFQDAQWAMPRAALDKLDEVIASVAPSSPTLLYRRLFSERDFDLYEEKGSYEEQRHKLEERRDQAVETVLTANGVEGVLEFARQVESPRKVGQALGRIPSEKVDRALLPDALSTAAGQILRSVGNSFVWGRYLTAGWSWIDLQLASPWSDEQKLALLKTLPFEPQTWDRAEAILGKAIAEYWKVVPANPWGLERAALLKAAENLLSCERAPETVECCYVMVHRKDDFPPEVAIRALQELKSLEHETGRLDQHHIQELIAWLQDHVTPDSDDLFQVEWTYLPFLDHRFGGTWPKTMEHRLATNPAFYCEVLAAIFQSEKDEKPKSETTDAMRNIAKNAYRLLSGWQKIPGLRGDGDFDPAAFSEWLAEVKRISSESGHFRIAMSQLGETLVHAPQDPGGLWIDKKVADALNARDAANMRSGFSTGLFNARGVYSPSGGVEEKAIAAGYRAKAHSLVEAGFHRFSETMLRLAEEYESQADRDAQSDPFSD